MKFEGLSSKIIQLNDDKKKSSAEWFFGISVWTFEQLFWCMTIFIAHNCWGLVVTNYKQIGPDFFFLLNTDSLFWDRDW